MKIGLLVTTFNRPDYLRQCLDSIFRTRLPEGLSVYIVDDCSTDFETKKLIDKFFLPNIEVRKFYGEKNKSIKNSLLFGCDLFFESGVNLVINLDADAIISNNFFEKVLEHKTEAPNNIVTGFNCRTKNRDGSDRHKIFWEGGYYNIKTSVGGINMCFNKEQYDKYIRPALVKCLDKGGNWDHNACINSMKDNLGIRCISPSVVQHLGENSSMNHSAGGEPMDVADDFKPLQLESITLIAVDDNVEGIIKAADISCRDIRFGSVKLLSCTPSDDKRVIPIRKLGSKKEYSQFLLKEIVDYIDTPYFIVIQSDGFLINWRGWSDEFYSVDLVGALWSWYNDGWRCCNGGCSMRSRRLHEITKNDDAIVLTNDHIITNYAEDHNLGKIYRKYLEDKYQIKFASDDLCNKFSIEGWMKPPPTNKYRGSFGFHGYGVDFNDAQLDYIPYKLPNRKIL